MRWPAIFKSYGLLCSEMAVYFCSGIGGYVVRWPAIFAVVWPAML